MKLFAIRNKETGEWFKTNRGKTTWSASGHAKSAWLNAQPSRSCPKRFDDQDKFEVVECVMVPKSDHEFDQRQLAWLSALECAGVDNWSGISDAYEFMEEGE